MELENYDTETIEVTSIGFFIDNVLFDDIIEGIRVDKIRHKTKSEFFNYYLKDIDFDESNEEEKIFKKYIDAIIDEGGIWDKCGEAYTVSEVLKMYFDNTEKRMCAMSMFEPSELGAFFEKEAKILSTEKVTKTQEKVFVTNNDINIHDQFSTQYLGANNIVKKKITYDDEYTLLSIPKSTMKIDTSNGEPNVYMVKCKDTSTSRVYYLYIKPEFAKGSAIDAIASTFQIEDENGQMRPITREEYLAMDAES